jgi:adenine-specific DNA-methyltransferase
LKYKENHDEIVSLGTKLLEQYSEIISANLPNKQQQIQSKIDYFENKINMIVYKLYELTEEEIKIVKENESI